MILIGMNGVTGTNLREGESIEIDQWWNDGYRDPVQHRNIEASLANRHDKPFVAWDGEGITYPGSRQQSYILFASSTGDYITAGEGNCLSTEKCFELLFDVESRIPDAIHIGFGFGYDTNQILNSLSKREVGGLYFANKNGWTYKWRDYRIKISPGKIFRVSRGENDALECVTIYDTFSFFQRRFVDVVKGYFPERLGEIESGKNNRSNFEYTNISEIIRYCLAENNLLVDIITRLRDEFAERGLYLNDWYGPGAVAAASFKKHNIKQAKGEIPSEVSKAAKFAYQGGRFELFRAGYYNGPVWQYDINSAYPSAITNLPDLSKGTWEYTKTFEPGSFGVWNIVYADRRTDRYDRYSRFRPQPFFYRNSDARIAYPATVEGWYWTPEAELVQTLEYPCDAVIQGGWVYRCEQMARPFLYIEDIYYERLAMKERGDPAERTLKLEMNSAYGKFAQRAGWHRKGDRVPSYHQLEWAGYITSHTRAKLFKAYQSGNLGNIIAFETDAIFTTGPMALDVGKNLGQWSETKLSNILYIQSGFYFANDGELAHYRGFDKGSINYDKCMHWLDSLDPHNTWSDNNPRLYGQTKRFIGFKRALQSRQPNYWRSWEQGPREISIGKDGKRVHMPGCPLCAKNMKWSEGLHGLTVSMHGGKSWPHRIPWDERREKNPWEVEKELASVETT